VCLVCAGLADGQPDRPRDVPAAGRVVVPRDVQQPTTRLPEQAATRTLSDTPQQRAILPHPPTRVLAMSALSGEGRTHVPAGDFRVPQRTLADAPVARNYAAARPEPGEKANFLPEASITRFTPDQGEGRVVVPLGSPPREDRRITPGDDR
jgi:hypothetical protein